MALYFFFNDMSGDLIYSDQDTIPNVGYIKLGEQTNTHPANPSDWVFDSHRANIQTVNKDVNISARINVLTSFGYMFNNCTTLVHVDLSGFDTSNVTDMRHMFNYCGALASLDLSNFNTSNVTNMSYIFCGCSVLTSLDLSSFDTSNVTNMFAMFSSCHALTSLDLSGFDTSNVTNMTDIFKTCPALRIIDISSNMSNILVQLPAATYYDAVTRQPYAKADIPGGSTYVRDLTDLDFVATMVQTRMGINVAKRLAQKALMKVGSIDIGGTNVDVVRVDSHQTGYDRDTLEIVTDSSGKVTEMYFVGA